MNSCWNENLIILSMVLGSTHSNSQIKIMVFGAHQELTSGQTWSKLPKIFKKLKFDVKLWKVKFWGDFDLVWLSSNLGLTRGILVILVEKGTLSASVFEQVAPHHSRCSHSPMESRWYFWIFRSPTCKLRADKLRYQHRKLIEKRSKWRISITPRPNFIVKLCVWVVN